jgi:hypothetical protein
MSIDDSCYAYWKDTYGSYVAESNNLMLYMTLKWDEQKLQNKVWLGAFRGCLYSFSLRPRSCLRC